jgi:hypothetical protein
MMILLYGTSYWNEVVNLEAMARHGVIAREDLSLIHFANDPAKALEILKAGLSMEMGPATPAIATSATPEERPM